MVVMADGSTVVNVLRISAKIKINIAGHHPVHNVLNK